MVAEGQPAPTFTLPSDSGEDVSLESFRGKPVVLYFYPKDDTPGCTAQALRDPRRVGRARAQGRGRPRREPGQPEQAREVPREVQAAVHAPLRRGARGRGEVRHLGREEHVRQEVHGHGALDVRDRPRRERCEDHAQGEARRARGRRAGRSPRSRALRPIAARCSIRLARARSARTGPRTCRRAGNPTTPSHAPRR